jgi:GNAT superfamily N-acetyltransferase
MVIYFYPMVWREVEYGEFRQRALPLLANETPKNTGLLSIYALAQQSAARNFVFGDHVAMAGGPPLRGVSLSHGCENHIESLIHFWASISFQPRKIQALAPVAQCFVRHFHSRAELTLKTNFYMLQGLKPPPRTSAVFRFASEADIAALAPLNKAFVEEGLHEPTTLEQAHENVTRHIATHRMGVLIDHDAIVSMALVRQFGEHGTVIGGVYTPPFLRGRGYASELVAKVCEAASSANSIVLHADAALPHTNRMYEKLGFVYAAAYESWKLNPA